MSHGFVPCFQLEEDVSEYFKKTLILNYGVDVDKNTTNRLITDAWDAMQRQVIYI